MNHSDCIQFQALGRRLSSRGTYFLTCLSLIALPWQVGAERPRRHNAYKERTFPYGSRVWSCAPGFRRALEQHKFFCLRDAPLTLFARQATSIKTSFIFYAVCLAARLTRKMKQKRTDSARKNCRQNTHTHKNFSARDQAKERFARRRMRLPSCPRILMCTFYSSSIAFVLLFHRLWVLRQRRRRLLNFIQIRKEIGWAHSSCLEPRAPIIAKSARVVLCCGPIFTLQFSPSSVFPRNKPTLTKPIRE